MDSGPHQTDKFEFYWLAADSVVNVQITIRCSAKPRGSTATSYVLLAHSHHTSTMLCRPR